MTDLTPAASLAPLVTFESAVATALDALAPSIRRDDGEFPGIAQLAILVHLGQEVRSAPDLEGRLAFHPLLREFGIWITGGGAPTIEIWLPPFVFSLERAPPPALVKILAFEMRDDDLALDADEASKAEPCPPCGFSADLIFDLRAALAVASLESPSERDEAIEMIGSFCAALGEVGHILTAPADQSPSSSLTRWLLGIMRATLRTGPEPVQMDLLGEDVKVTFELDTFEGETPLKVVRVARRG